MATRRIRATVNNKYVQPLKMRMDRKLVVSANNDYTSILFTKKHKGFDLRSLVTKVWAKFNTDTFDGIQLVANLYKQNDVLTSSASCVFKIYNISTDQNWTQTLIYTTNGTYNGNWIATVTQANLGSVDLDGEPTLKIEAVITSQGKEFKSSVYVNHLGIYDSLFRLKQEVEFLSITKKDE